MKENEDAKKGLNNRNLRRPVNLNISRLSARVIVTLTC